MTPHPSRQLFFAELDHKSLSALANEILGTAEKLKQTPWANMSREFVLIVIITTIFVSLYYIFIL